MKSTIEIINNLLQIVQEHQWIEKWKPCSKGCCGDWIYECPDCSVEIFRKDHLPDCKIDLAIKDAENFLTLEQDLKD